MCLRLEILKNMVSGRVLQQGLFWNHGRLFVMRFCIIQLKVHCRNNAKEQEVQSCYNRIYRWFLKNVPQQIRSPSTTSKGHLTSRKSPANPFPFRTTDPTKFYTWNWFSNGPRPLYEFDDFWVSRANYSRVSNKRAACFINFSKNSNLHGLITSCTFY